MNVLVLLLCALGMATLAGAAPSSWFAESDEFAEEEDLLDDIVWNPARRAAVDLYYQQYEALSGGVNDTTKRKAIATSKYLKPAEDIRWIDGKIPYIIDAKFGEQKSNDIYDAIKHYIDNTNLKFFPRTSETDYVIFTLLDPAKSGCGLSWVGRIDGAQKIQLKISSSCDDLFFGNTAHEIGHAIGFFHEQNRSDRDEYIIVHKDAVSDGNWDNFMKEASNNYGIPYDYGSLMQYPGKAFSKNLAVTMEAKDKTVTKLGQKYGLSSRDSELVYKMYNGDDRIFMKTDGKDYRGKIATTVEGNKCQNWKSHKGSFTDENFVLGSLGNHNHCRNPTPNSFAPLTNPPTKPWCYTSSEEASKKYCNVGSPRTCQSDKPGDVECYSDPMGGDYKGKRNKAKVGDEEQTCIAYNPLGMQEGFAECRNPKPNAYEGTGTSDSSSNKPWCYTKKRIPGWRLNPVWGYCDVGEPYLPG